MVDITSENWELFECDDHLPDNGFFATDALSVVGEDLICIAASFEDYTDVVACTRLYKFNHGVWTAEDMEEQIVSAVNLRDRYDITADHTINMLFITDEGRVFTVGAENNQFFLRDKIKMNDDRFVSFMNQKLIGDKLLLFGFNLIVEYSHGEWKNISENLYQWSPDDPSYTVYDIAFINGEYFIYCSDAN